MHQTNIIARLKRSEIADNICIPSDLSKIICMYAISAGELLIEASQQMDQFRQKNNISPIWSLILDVTYHVSLRSSTLSISRLTITETLISHSGATCVDDIDTMDDLLGNIWERVISGEMRYDIYEAIEQIVGKMCNACAFAK